MSHEAEQVLEALIAEAEELLPLTYDPDRYPGMAWHAETWDYQEVGTAKVRQSTVSFRAHPRDGRARFHPRYEYALKAYFVHATPGASKSNSVIGGARALWSVLLQEGIDPVRFRWTSVNAAVLESVERHMLDHFSIKPNSAAIYMMALANFLDWLRVEGVLPAGLELKRSLRLETPRSLSPQDRKLREARMVSRDVLTRLADCYATATEERDRLLICAIGLLVVAGFRLGELLILPVDGLQSETVNGRQKWYIRFWQRKSGKGKRLEENKRWLSPLGAELAQRLWTEILERTEDARKAARELEKDPSCVRIPWLGPDVEWVTIRDLERAFGWAGRVSRSGALQRAGIESVTAQQAGLLGMHEDAPVWRRGEIEELLYTRREPLVTHITGTRKVQHLSGTLLITFEQQMDARKLASELLVRRLSRKVVEQFLDGREKVSPLGEDQRAGSHGFRHWIHTVANKAGMSAFLISVWMQRANMEHTLHYLHDPLDVAEMAREGLRDGRYRGPGAERIYGLAEDAREKQIDSIQMAHVAATVICGLDLTHAECPEQKLCELCDYGLYDPESASMRRELTARLRTLESNRERLEKLRGRGIPIHDRQFEQADEAISEIRRRLGVGGSPVAVVPQLVKIAPRAEVLA